MKALILLSGGVDSSTALGYYLALGFECEALSFDYGQRHRRELEAAKEIADHYDVAHEIMELPAVFGVANALTGVAEVPTGAYSNETMKDTVVPGRNLVMISLAAAVAKADLCDAVVVGCHAGDHEVYRDCRPEFFAAMGKAIWEGVEGVSLHAPFENMTKREIVQLGDSLLVPYVMTYSCYKGRDEHCGECSTCLERQDAMAL